MATPTVTSALRFAFRSIFLTFDDQPEDRATWYAATPAEQAQAEREVRAQSASAGTQRLTKTEAGQVAKLAW